MKCLVHTAVLAAVLALAPLCSAQGGGDDLNHAFAAAQQLLAAGDLNGARQKFAALARVHPEIAELHATLGALLFQQGDFAASLQELQTARHLKPTLPRLDSLIAMDNAELGQYDVAITPLESAFHNPAEELTIKRHSGLELERAYTATGRDIKAVAIALELQQLFPKDPEVLYHNERIFGNFAYLTVQTLSRVAPDSTWRYQAQAEAEESQGNHNAAIAAYKKILSLDPNRPGIHYRIGRALRERARDTHHPEDLQLAMEQFNAELKLDSHSANAAYEIGELHRLAGELPAAKLSFEAALKSFPDFPEANLGLGTVLASMNQPAAALPHLRRAITSDPADEATWYRLAQVERALGHVEQQKAALAEFQRLHHVEAGPTSPQAAARDVSHQTIDPDRN